jgi:hypothetical protein
MTLTLHFVSQSALAAAQPRSISWSSSGAARTSTSFHIPIRPGFAAVQSNRNQPQSNQIGLNQTKSSQLAEKGRLAALTLALIKKSHLN